MAVTLTGSDSATSAIEQHIAEIMPGPETMERALDAIAQEVILGNSGTLARNYERSGLKQRSGLLFRAITDRTWPGNYVRVQGKSVTVGLDLRTVYYANWAINGRGPVVPKKKKVLMFYIDGQKVFAKRVRATPARVIYLLYPQDLAKAAEVAERVIGMSGVKVTSA